MATADTAVLDDFLNAFQGQVDTGFGLISGDVTKVFSLLVIISVAATALMWALDDAGNVSAALVRKIMLVGVFSWILGSWRTVSSAVAQGFAALGLKAGSGSLSLSDFMQAPTKVVTLGLSDALAIARYIGQISQQGYGIGFFAHFDVILIAAVCAVGLILAFIVLAVEIAVTVIEFHVVTLIAYVTIPFGVLGQTAFLADRAIAYAFAVGVKLMALAIVVSIGETVFATYTVSAQPAAAEECGLLLSSVLMVFLAAKIPAAASGLVSGGPSLTAGSVSAAVGGAAAAANGSLLAMRNVTALLFSAQFQKGGGTDASKTAAGAYRQGAPPPQSVVPPNATTATRDVDTQEKT